MTTALAASMEEGGVMRTLVQGAAALIGPAGRDGNGACAPLLVGREEEKGQ